MEIAIGLTAFITSGFNKFSTKIFKYLSYSCNRGFIDNNVEIVEVVDDSSKKEVRRATKCPLNLLFFEFFYEFKEDIPAVFKIGTTQKILPIICKICG